MTCCPIHKQRGYLRKATELGESSSLKQQDAEEKLTLVKEMICLGVRIVARSAWIIDPAVCSEMDLGQPPGLLGGRQLCHGKHAERGCGEWELFEIVTESPPQTELTEGRKQQHACGRYGIVLKDFMLAMLTHSL